MKSRGTTADITNMCDKTHATRLKTIGPPSSFGGSHLYRALSQCRTIPSILGLQKKIDEKVGCRDKNRAIRFGTKAHATCRSHLEGQRSPHGPKRTKDLLGLRISLPNGTLQFGADDLPGQPGRPRGDYTSTLLTPT